LPTVEKLIREEGLVVSDVRDNGDSMENPMGRLAVVIGTALVVAMNTFGMAGIDGINLDDYKDEFTYVNPKVGDTVCVRSGLVGNPWVTEDGKPKHLVSGRVDHVENVIGSAKPRRQFYVKPNDGYEISVGPWQLVYCDTRMD
jgi:hypothetical protein